LFFLLEDGFHKIRRIHFYAGKTGTAIPDFAKSIPRLLDKNAFYYYAFQSLTTCRGIFDSGIGRIPWDKIMDYCDRYNVNGQEMEFFCEVIEKLDYNYVSKVNKSNAGS